MNESISTIASFILSALITYIMVPVVIEVAKEKKLYDVPNQRSSHTRIIPSLGGIAIFCAFTISFLLLSNGYLINELKYITASVIILFMVGIQDDIMELSPKKKIIGELIAAFIITVLADIRFTSFHGILGIWEISYFASVTFTIFVIIVLVNGFNLIDGIDGLASGVSSLCALIFGIYFFINKDYEFVILSASLVGTLISFFIFNVYGTKNKIFMGDTGSLIIGLLISIMAIRFNNLIAQKDIVEPINNSPIFTIAVLCVPIFDVARVMFIRIKQGRSPFSPDKNHVHHRLISLGFVHVKATYIIMSVNLLFIAVALVFNGLNTYMYLLLIVFMGVFFSWLPSFLLNRKQN